MRLFFRQRTPNLAAALANTFGATPPVLTGAFLRSVLCGNDFCALLRFGRWIGNKLIFYLNGDVRQGKGRGCATSAGDPMSSCTRTPSQLCGLPPRPAAFAANAFCLLLFGSGGVSFGAAFCFALPPPSLPPFVFCFKY